MAKTTHLEYHEDKVAKRDLRPDDITFLKALQTELNTQDTVCEADPRYWTIVGSERIYHVEPEFADGFVIGDMDGNIVAETMERAMQLLISRFHWYCFLSADGSKISYKVDPSDEDESWSIISTFEEVVQLLNYDCERYKLVGFIEVEKRYSSSMFLTHRNAAKYLYRNDYKLSADAHTYAETSPDPDMEKLIQILHEIDFEKVEEMLQQYKDPATFAKDYEVHETSGFVKDFIDQKIAENAKSQKEEMEMRNFLEDGILEEVTITYLDEARKYPTGDDEAFCEDAAWDYFLDRYKDIQFEESHSDISATYHDYGPCNPWDAPGMSVSDFI